MPYGDAGSPITGSPPACRVYHNAAQSITDSVVTTLAFNSERWDTNTMHDTVTNNGRVTFATAGLYVVTLHVGFAAAADYLSIMAVIRVNGATGIAEQFLGSQTDANDNYYISLTTVYRFAAADYMEARVWQNNSANAARNVVAVGNQSPEFAAVWVGLGT